MSYKGPICDTLGFSQHGVNCATDTILQVLMFTDGLKATTQRALYTMDHEELVRRTQAVFPEDEWPTMVRYFELIQERFRHHYDALQCELEFTEGCEKLNTNIPPTCPVFLHKQKRSPELATASRLAFARDEESKDIGTPMPRIRTILPYLFRWFRVPYGITDDYTPATFRAGFIKTAVYSPGNHKPSSHHLSAVLLCNSRWYYYSNSVGLIEKSDKIIPFLKDIVIIHRNDRIFIARQSNGRIVGLWFGTRDENRTEKAIRLVADEDGHVYNDASIERVEYVLYCSKLPVADRLSPIEEDEILGKVATIVGEDEETPSFKNVRKAFRSVARTYGKPSTRRHKRVLNIGRTILSRMHPNTHKQTRKTHAKPKSHTRKRHRGGYIPTARNLHYLRLWKKHKSIGFTMRSSLKAKGLIPRADGTYRVSDKYKTR